MCRFSPILQIRKLENEQMKFCIQKSYCYEETEIRFKLKSVSFQVPLTLLLHSQPPPWGSPFSGSQSPSLASPSSTQWSPGGQPSEDHLGSREATLLRPKMKLLPATTSPSYITKEPHAHNKAQETPVWVLDTKKDLLLFYTQKTTSSGLRSPPKIPFPFGSLSIHPSILCSQSLTPKD